MARRSYHEPYPHPTPEMFFLLLLKTFMGAIPGGWVRRNMEDQETTSSVGVSPAVARVIPAEGGGTERCQGKNSCKYRTFVRNRGYQVEDTPGVSRPYEASNRLEKILSITTIVIDEDRG